MEESCSISWRAKLAKSNINILNIQRDRVFLEFTYHPKPGTFKWCKTVFDIPHKWLDQSPDPVNWHTVHLDSDELADYILEQVLTLRKELEGSYGSKR